jgi:type I restriction enzyme M protein
LKKRAEAIRSKLNNLFLKYIPPASLPVEQISVAMPLALCLAEERLDPRFWSAKIAALNKMFLGRRDTFRLIGEIISEPVHRGRQPPYDDVGETVPVLKTTDVQNSRIDWGRCRRVSDVALREYRAAQTRRDDLILTCTGEGSWGRASIVNADKAWADGHLAIVRVDGRMVDPYAVLAFLWSEYGLMQFGQRMRGSTRQTEIYPRDIEKIRILIPSEPDQKMIRKEILAQFSLLDEAQCVREECVQTIESLLESNH